MTQDHFSASKLSGRVCLVGAGRGDPELLTVKALRRLESADVVFHDALVSPEILALASQRAQLIDVGKRCGRKCITQDEINKLLVSFASQGKIVVRLKSGDPLVFGRAGEELEVLRNAGIAVEVVPGITAAVAAAAVAKMSLTDRRFAERLLLLSAHRAEGKQVFDSSTHITPNTTVVVYMPGEYQTIADQLIKCGLEPTLPCVVVSRISMPDESAFKATLQDVHAMPALSPPSLLITGEAVQWAQFSFSNSAEV